MRKPKRELYYSGAPLNDPRQPLPGEMSPERKRAFVMAGGIIGAGVIGLALGFTLAPQAPGELEAKVATLEKELASERLRAEDLERTLQYRETEKPVEGGKLRPDVRRKHEEMARRYVALLKGFKAQGAAELMDWFVRRWNDLLDQPQPDDRVSRRAATLSLLVGGMAENMHPEDFVQWQAGFFSTRWLGELHFDLDGDQLPGKRGAKNPKDGFANVSVCHIAMALNQSVVDAQILMMPDMRCDRPASRMSIFLQGSTFDDAIDEFVEAVKREGYVVVQRQEKGVRMVLVGMGTSGN